WCVERDGDRMFYGFPDFGEGVKIAHHGSGIPADPDDSDRTVRDDEVARARDALASFVPDAAGDLARVDPCMYTLTPDEHFVIGPAPGSPRVLIAGGFSGHGFKFAPVVGEIVATMLAGEAPPFDLSIFAPDRFTPSTAPQPIPETPSTTS